MLDCESREFGSIPWLHPKIINYEILQLPFENQSIYTIFCSHILEHLPTHQCTLAIKEWARVLKKSDPQGGLHFGIPDLDIILKHKGVKIRKDDTYESYITRLIKYQFSSIKERNNIKNRIVNDFFTIQDLEKIKSNI